MRIALFRESESSFLKSLDAAGIPYQLQNPRPGAVTASGTIIDIAQTAAVAGAVATVLTAWIKARASRRVILTLQGNKIVHIEGYSVAQVQELIPLVDRVDVIDTVPAEKSKWSVKPTPLRRTVYLDR